MWSTWRREHRRRRSSRLQSPDRAHPATSATNASPATTMTRSGNCPRIAATMVSAVVPVVGCLNHETQPERDDRTDATAPRVRLGGRSSTREPSKPPAIHEPISPPRNDASPIVSPVAIPITPPYSAATRAPITRTTGATATNVARLIDDSTSASATSCPPRNSSPSPSRLADNCSTRSVREGNRSDPSPADELPADPAGSTSMNANSIPSVPTSSGRIWASIRGSLLEILLRTTVALGRSPPLQPDSTHGSSAAAAFDLLRLAAKPPARASASRTRRATGCRRFEAAAEPRMVVHLSRLGQLATHRRRSVRRLSLAAEYVSGLLWVGRDHQEIGSLDRGNKRAASWAPFDTTPPGEKIVCDPRARWSDPHQHLRHCRPASTPMAPRPRVRLSRGQNEPVFRSRVGRSVLLSTSSVITPAPRSRSTPAHLAVNNGTAAAATAQLPPLPSVELNSEPRSGC